MKGVVFYRDDHCTPQNHFEIEFSSPEEAVSYLRKINTTSCGCCVPRFFSLLDDGRLLKADTFGYWISCKHGRWACEECGDPSIKTHNGEPYDGSVGPIVPGSDWIEVHENA